MLEERARTLEDAAVKLRRFGAYQTEPQKMGETPGKSARNRMARCGGKKAKSSANELQELWEKDQASIFFGKRRG
jgi:hypothetical protein